MADLKPCGTLAAYKRHIRYGEDPCDDCRKAWNAYISDYTRRTKAAGGPLTKPREDES